LLIKVAFFLKLSIKSWGAWKEIGTVICWWWECTSWILRGCHFNKVWQRIIYFLSLSLSFRNWICSISVFLINPTNTYLIFTYLLSDH
jgi:hypothetical protein